MPRYRYGKESREHSINLREMKNQDVYYYNTSYY